MNLRSRMLERDVALLRAAGLRVRLDPDRVWVLVEGFRLPRGWRPAETTLLIEPPPNFPDSAPDGFYMGGRLQRDDGGGLRQPGHYFADYKNRYAQQGYFWYCLEDNDQRWDRRYDSLLTFVEAIRTYLGTAD